MSERDRRLCKGWGVGWQRQKIRGLKSVQKSDFPRNATGNLGGHLSCSAGMGLGEPSAEGGQEQNGNPFGPGSVGAQAESGVRDP